MNIQTRIFFIFFVTKIILDFFSPFRELNMVIQLCLILPILTKASFIQFIINHKLNFVLVYFLFYIVVSHNIQSIKIFISVIFFCAFAFIGGSTNLNILIKKSKLIWKVGIISFLISLTLSVILGKYSKREFYNFEHVNLLGSYLVFLSIFYLIYYKYNDNRHLRVKSAFFPIAATFLSLSTGSFIAQLTAYIPAKYYKLKNITHLSFLLILVVVASYFITSSFSPDLHQKIFGTIDYFQKETSIKEFYQDSIHLNLDLFHAENSGSFTWRIFAYTFYLHNIFNQNLFNFLFGSGVESFLLFAPFAPHNDFIAIFLDFGLIGLLCFIIFLSRIFRMAIRNNFKILVVFIIFLILRLLFENVIYSSYLFSFISAIGGLLYGSLKLKKS